MAGLDKDYLGKSFGPMPELMISAEYVTKVLAICVKCRIQLVIVKEFHLNLTKLLLVNQITEEDVEIVLNRFKLKI